MPLWDLGVTRYSVCASLGLRRNWVRGVCVSLKRYTFVFRPSGRIKIPVKRYTFVVRPFGWLKAPGERYTFVFRPFGWLKVPGERYTFVFRPSWAMVCGVV